MIQLPKKLKNYTCYVDGIGYAGRVAELEPPKLTLKTEEFRGGGMDFPVDMDMGMEKLEATLTFAEYLADLFAQLGLVNGQLTAVTLRGAIQEKGDAEEVIISLRGMFKEMDPGSWKAGDDSTLKAVINAHYYKLTIGGKEIVEIDSESMVRIINGTDQLASHRKALGL